MSVLGKKLEELIHQEEQQKKEQVLADPYRLRYHLMPPVGWLNDPNGLCYYQGKYHVFFQYAPFDATGGLKVWGHYCSEDLLHWEYVGIPLLPDGIYDCHGVYSGSALVDDGILEVFYTGNIKMDGDFDYINDGRKAYTIYTKSEDGIHFGEKECLMQMEDYPKEYTCHIRDPKVWKEGNHYFMVLGGRKKNDQGAVLLYESADKKQWKLKQEITTKEKFGYMWECPDLFSVGTVRVLSISPQGEPREEEQFQNIYHSGYFVMDREGELCPMKEEFCEWDMGFDFYAPQTFLDGQGRRILYGWAGLPDVEEEYTNPTVQSGWQHCLTIPREITERNGKLYQNPVEELKQLRKAREILEEGTKRSFPEGCYECEIREINGHDFRAVLSGDLVLTYENHVFSIRFEGKAGAGRSVRNARLSQLDTVRILADTSIVEIYINEGETVFTTRYYPEEASIEVNCPGSSSQTWKLS